MRTRQGFDLGANFLVKAYPELLSLAREQEVTISNLSPAEHVVYRGGKFHSLNFDSLRELVRMKNLGLWNRVRLAEFVLRLRRRHPGLDFFDLSSTPDELNGEDAYSLASRAIGRDFADYILDGFHSCMMFYRAHETSAAAFLALLSMKTDPACDFSILWPEGGMQTVPDALCRVLPVRLGCEVLSVARVDGGWEVTTAEDVRRYRRVVLATTATAARLVLQGAPPGHRELLDKVRYACTVNLSFSVSPAVLGNIHCVYVPFVENEVVAEFTNEGLKGDHLVNVGLHEAAARKLMAASDGELFEVVGRELGTIHPGLRRARPHDLQRWSEAIPKYDRDSLARVKRFLGAGQGQEGLYLCGDYLNAPWTEGACRSGRRVARLLQLVPS